MNCQQAERWILLKQSGELSFRKRWRLERHLTVCAYCRHYREDMERVFSVAQKGLASGEPGVQALAAIREAARAGIRQQGKPEWGRIHELMMVAWRPTLACAAILLLCLAGWYWLAGRGITPTLEMKIEALPPEADTVALPPADELDDFSSMLSDDVVYIERLSDLARHSEVSPVDRDILLLEGLAI